MAAEFTNRQKADVALREVAMRRRVYGRWVQTGRIAHAEAKFQIGAMQEIADDYTRQADAAGEPIGTLL